MPFRYSQSSVVFGLWLTLHVIKLAISTISERGPDFNFTPPIFNFLGLHIAHRSENKTIAQNGLRVTGIKLNTSFTACHGVQVGEKKAVLFQVLLCIQPLYVLKNDRGKCSTRCFPNGNSRGHLFLSSLRRFLFSLHTLGNISQEWKVHLPVLRARRHSWGKVQPTLLAYKEYLYNMT